MQASKATLQGRQAAAAAGGASGAGTSSGQLALEAPPAARCDGCKQPAAKLLRCARCKAAVYCSKACQIKAWPAHKSDGSCQPQGKEN